ncbi:MAG: hypothetical protein NTW33_00510 [Methanoregula sp.]|nr:hypothetical protein [Methanoregula sp.]
MKFSATGSIAILLFVLAVSFAGCSDPEQQEPSVTSPHVTIKTTGTPAATTILKRLRQSRLQRRRIR